MSGDVHSEKPHHNEPHENPSPGYFNDTPTTTTDLNGIFSHEQSRHHEYSDKPAKLSPLHAFKHPFVCARSFSRRISAFLPEMTVDPAPSGSGLVIDSEAPPKKRKLTGREFWESIGSPKTIVAPMVEQSEYVCPPLSPQALHPLTATGMASSLPPPFTPRNTLLHAHVPLPSLRHNPHVPRSILPGP